MSVKNLIEARLRLERAKSELNIAKAELQAAGNSSFKRTISEVEDTIRDLDIAANQLTKHIED